jgi:RNA polymerase sigma-70 factor, ECF subfamily
MASALMPRRGERLPVQPARAGFQARRELDNGPDARALTSRAVARAKQGDPEALRFLYVRFADNVFGYVRSIVHDEHDAEDITQQVFAKLLTALGKYQERSMPFTAWLLRVAHNMAIDHLRSRRQLPCEEVRGTDTPDEQRGDDCRRDLWAALDELPDEQRSVVVLRHVAGLSPGEIANHLGRSEDSVHGLHHRGRRALREALVRMEAAPVVLVG